MPFPRMKQEGSSEHYHVKHKSSEMFPSAQHTTQNPQCIHWCSKIHPKGSFPHRTALAHSCTGFQMVHLFSPSLCKVDSLRHSRTISLLYFKAEKIKVLLAKRSYLPKNKIQFSQISFLLFFPTQTHTFQRAQLSRDLKETPDDWQPLYYSH